MKMQIMHEDESLSTHLQDCFIKLIAAQAEKMAIPLENVSSVIAASPSKYSAAIKSIDINERSTDGSEFVGVGKTININGLNHVVFQFDYLYGALLASHYPGRLPVKLEQQCIYVLAHELGHCWDNIVRPITTPQVPGINPFSIQEVADYYGFILETELAACAHSSHAMGCITYDLDLESLLEWAEEFCVNLKRLRHTYGGSARELLEMGCLASTGFWFVLVQLSKLVISERINPKLPRNALSFLGKVSILKTRSLDSFADCLAHLWRTYPLWGVDTRKVLHAVWHSFSEENGYKFIETPRGSELYLV